MDRSSERRYRPEDRLELGAVRGLEREERRARIAGRFAEDLEAGLDCRRQTLGDDEAQQRQELFVDLPRPIDFARRERLIQGDRRRRAQTRGGGAPSRGLRP